MTRYASGAAIRTALEDRLDRASAGQPATHAMQMRKIDLVLIATATALGLAEFRDDSRSLFCARATHSVQAGSTTRFALHPP